MTDPKNTAVEKALKDAGTNHAGDLGRLNERLLARADREGLIDVAYATMDSPYGELLVAATERGVVKLSLPNYTAEDALEQIAAGVSPRILESPKRLDPVRRELDAYFEGKLENFCLEGGLDARPRLHRQGPAHGRAHPLRQDAELRRGRREGRQPARLPGRRAPPAAPTRCR